MPKFKGYLNAVYGSPRACLRSDLWDNIRDISKGISDHWILIGDFNTFLHPDNKRGGRLVTVEQCRDFVNCVQDYSLIEIESTSSLFTWEG